jgi:hypothetical protein
MNKQVDIFQQCSSEVDLKRMQEGRPWIFYDGSNLQIVLWSNATFACFYILNFPNRIRNTPSWRFKKEGTPTSRRHS